MHAIRFFMIFSLLIPAFAHAASGRIDLYHNVDGIGDYGKAKTACWDEDGNRTGNWRTRKKRWCNGSYMTVKIFRNFKWRKYDPYRLHYGCVDSGQRLCIELSGSDRDISTSCGTSCSWDE